MVLSLVYFTLYLQNSKSYPLGAFTIEKIRFLIFIAFLYIRISPYWEVNCKQTKLCNFLIRYHTKLPQDGVGMYPSCDVMLIIAILNSLVLYVKRAIEFPI